MISMNEAQLQAAAHVRWVCRQYGLFGNIFDYTPSSIPGGNRNRFYIVAGIYPELEEDQVPKWLYPEDIIRKQNQNKKLFYPNIWTFDMTTAPNDVCALEQLVEYLKRAEFLKVIYAEYAVELPEKLRVSEINQLIYFRDMSHNPQLDAKTLKKCRSDLKWFFKREKCKGFRRRWLDYFRSEKFPDDKGPVAKIKGYFKRDSQITSIELLFKVNDSIRKLEMQECEYRRFAKWMKDLYPHVTYAISNISKVDHGGAGNPVETHAAIGKRVTQEEFAEIRKERFAAEGWAALENLVPVYWEFREVYYKACDEPLIASVYNAITLEYARCTPLDDMYGNRLLLSVPLEDFMNFVSLAKANKVKFYIDNLGDYAIPSLVDVHVVYCEHQSETIYGIMERLVNDKVSGSHII